MDKYELLPQQLLREGTCDPSDFFEPIPAPIKVVALAHDSTYIQRLLNLDLTPKEIRSIGFPLSPELISREFLIAGGTISGAEQALSTGVAFNIAGGTHHAFRSKGEAFCLLNDQAIAAHYMILKKKAKKILIFDLDVHQGNGTAEICRTADSIYTCSVHGAKNYPFQKEVSDFDLALEDQTEDAIYLAHIEKLLPELVDKVKPDFIFYLSGVDVLSTDKLGRLGLSLAGCKMRDRIVFEFVHNKGIPLQCSMGGGYSKDLKIIIEAHANTYREAKRIFT